jgi:hypothetical protein
MSDRQADLANWLWDNCDETHDATATMSDGQVAVHAITRQADLASRLLWRDNDATSHMQAVKCTDEQAVKCTDEHAAKGTDEQAAKGTDEQTVKCIDEQAVRGTDDPSAGGSSSSMAGSCSMTSAAGWMAPLAGCSMQHERHREGVYAAQSLLNQQLHDNAWLHNRSDTDYSTALANADALCAKYQQEGIRFKIGITGNPFHRWFMIHDADWKLYPDQNYKSMEIVYLTSSSADSGRMEEALIKKWRDFEMYMPDDGRFIPVLPSRCQNVSKGNDGAPKDATHHMVYIVSKGSWMDRNDFVRNRYESSLWAKRSTKLRALDAKREKERERELALAAKRAKVQQ